MAIPPGKCILMKKYISVKKMQPKLLFLSWIWWKKFLQQFAKNNRLFHILNIPKNSLSLKNLMLVKYMMSFFNFIMEICFLVTSIQKNWHWNIFTWSKLRLLCWHLLKNIEIHWRGGIFQPCINSLCQGYFVSS